MSDCWRNSVEVALGAGVCGDQLPRASLSMLKRCGVYLSVTCAAVVDGQIAVTTGFER